MRGATRCTARWVAPCASVAPLPARRFAAQTLAALNVMRDHAASDPQRKLELAGLLASGTVTQAAINHAGNCDGGERGGSCALGKEKKDLLDKLTLPDQREEDVQKLKDRLEVVQTNISAPGESAHTARRCPPPVRLCTHPRALARPACPCTPLMYLT